MDNFLKYGLLFSYMVNFITVLSPLLIWTELSKIPIFGLIVILYLPFAFILIYPAIGISIFCAGYTGVKMLKVAHNSSLRFFLAISVVSLFLHMLAIYLRHRF